MNRPAFDLSHSRGPGPAAADAHARAVWAAERFDYAAATEQLWKAAQDPPHADGRNVLQLALDTAANYAAGRRTI